ncbi:MAG: zf-HC2 domain-containing protein [Gaiellaceae bacterium]
MEPRLNRLMDAAGGQLCARARYWVSLRVDGELSELEGALLDAHLGRCDGCRAVADGFGATTSLLRATPQEPVPSLVLDLPRSPRRLLATVAVAALLAIGVIAGTVVGAESSHRATPSPRIVAVVASAETPDQLRRLRRTTLLNMRKLPHELTAIPV